MDPFGDEPHEEEFQDHTNKHGDELTSGEKSALWSGIQMGIAQKLRKQKRRVMFRRLSSVAAGVLLVIGLGWWWIDRSSQPGQGTPFDQFAKSIEGSFAPGSLERVELTLDDGQIVRIDNESKITYADSTLLIVDGSGNSRTERVSIAPETRYHTVRVPYGQRVDIQLPDGSWVWLNAGSVLSYPSTYTHLRRDIFLQGEGYFDVKHMPDQPFTVHTRDLRINVLGTTFNVSAYEDDAYTATVLHEGSIALQGNDLTSFSETRINPGTRAVFDRAQQQLALEEGDFSDDISWTKKQLILNQKSMAEILKNIERVYNAEIAFIGTIDQSTTFSGSLDVSKPLVDVLSYLYDPNKYSLTQKERRVFIQRK